jgi:transcriptional regulator with AAA-type ATPase domain
LASEVSPAQSVGWLLENGPRELELLFRAIVYHPSVPILIADNDRNYLDASAGAGKLLGLSRDITTAPLRDHPEDIPLLVRRFTQKYAPKMSKQIDKIPSETMRALESWSWPGNVRELENFIERAVILPRPQSARPIGRNTGRCIRTGWR